MAGVKGRSGGCNRKSGQLHVLTGTFRADRHQADAPEPPAGAPKAPRDLKGAARQEWKRMVARLTDTRTLTTVDGPLLEQYCRLWSDAARLQAEADALQAVWFDRVTVTRGGVEHREPKVHPVFSTLARYRLALRVLLVELGLTPLSRGRIKTASPAAPATDPKKARYLSGLPAK